MSPLATSLPPTLQHLRDRPGMFMQTVNVDTVTAFVDGYDAALDSGLLVGFREWLIGELEDGNNLAWPALVELLRERRGGEAAEPIAFCFATLERFLADRADPNGLRRIFARYEGWLLLQEWYTPGSPQWITYG